MSPAAVRVAAACCSAFVLHVASDPTQLAAEIAADDFGHDSLSLVQLRSRQLQALARGREYIADGEPDDQSWEGFHQHFVPQSKAKPIFSAIQDSEAEAADASDVEEKVPHYHHPKWLDSCSSIFLDLGANIGVAVRKLYEPEKYPDSKLLPFFEQSFGTPAERRKESALCALALEPNPRHAARLSSLEDSYMQRGWNVHFYPYAAWSSEGIMTLNSTSKRPPSSDDTVSLGAHLSSASTKTSTKTSDTSVRTVDIDAFLSSLPLASVKLAMMDIEGSEYEVFAQLVKENGLCKERIQTLLVEAHEWGDVTHWAHKGQKGMRSFSAIEERVKDMAGYDSCEKGVVKLREFSDTTYPLDVDDRFGEESALDTETSSATAVAPAVNAVTATSLSDSGVAVDDDSTQANPAGVGFGHPSWLSSCTSILLDLGSNIGVGVRKVFEPEKYPGALLLPRLQHIFGSAEERRAPGDKSGVCVLGLEPNPKHMSHLSDLEEAYAAKGWRAHFYPFAAWSSEGKMSFNTTGKLVPGPDDVSELGAHLSKRVEEPGHDGAKHLEVRTVDLAAFIRSLPANSLRLMLMDIEGAEYQTLSQLIGEGMLCKSSVQSLAVDAHSWGQMLDWSAAASVPAAYPPSVHMRTFEAIQRVASQLSELGSCGADGVTEISKLEDKTYAKDVNTPPAAESEDHPHDKDEGTPLKASSATLDQAAVTPDVSKLESTPFNDEAGTSQAKEAMSHLLALDAPLEVPPSSQSIEAIEKQPSLDVSVPNSLQADIARLSQAGQPSVDSPGEILVSSDNFDDDDDDYEPVSETPLEVPPSNQSIETIKEQPSLDVSVPNALQADIARLSQAGQPLVDSPGEILVSSDNFDDDDGDKPVSETTRPRPASQPSEAQSVLVSSHKSDEADNKDDKAVSKSESSATPEQESHAHDTLERVNGASSADYGHPSWLSTCETIFLDVGSNTGVNARKLYEPERFPGATLLPFFDDLFGPGKERKGDAGLCALGLEPNPEHSERLSRLEAAHTEKGWHTHFYPFAAWSREGRLPLNSTGPRDREGGGSSVAAGAHLLMTSPAQAEAFGATEVRTVDFSDFVRSLPSSASVRMAVMDIEGSEYETITQLMKTNVLCKQSIENMFIEAHGWGETHSWGEPSTFKEGVHPRSFEAIRQRVDQLEELHWCKPDNVTTVNEMDDVTYSEDPEDGTDEPLQRQPSAPAPALAGADAGNKTALASATDAPLEVWSPLGPPIANLANSATEQATPTPASKVEKALPDFKHPDWLSSCKSIFVDLGSNIGVGVRKLYEAEKYPGAALAPLFDKAFGAPDSRRGPAATTGLCALGLEPNPAHAMRLQSLQDAYQEKGWHVNFYPYAAWSGVGVMSLNVTGKHDPSPHDVTEQGAHLSQLEEGDGSVSAEVQTIDLADFLQTLPKGSVSLIVMDIEGAEYETLAHLSARNMLCKDVVPKLAIEAHNWGDVTNWRKAVWFPAEIRPHSFEAIEQFAHQAESACIGGGFAEMSPLDDATYPDDVDDKFGDMSSLPHAAPSTPVIPADAVEEQPNLEQRIKNHSEFISHAKHEQHLDEELTSHLVGSAPHIPSAAELASQTVDRQKVNAKPNLTFTTDSTVVPRTIEHHHTPAAQEIAPNSDQPQVAPQMHSFAPVVQELAPISEEAKGQSMDSVAVHVSADVHRKRNEEHADAVLSSMPANWAEPAVLNYTAGEYDHPEWLKECHYIFLDLGSNIGVNVRKFYEAEKYEGADLLPYLDEAFGGPAQRRNVSARHCVLALEPNPVHQRRLQRLEQRYTDQGHRVHVYPYAVWSEEGLMALNVTGKRAPLPNETTNEGAHLLMKSDEDVQASITTVRTVDIVAFIKTLPYMSVKLMVMDIEGAEYEALAQFMHRDALCYELSAKMLVEAHGWGEIEHWGSNESFPEGVHPRSWDAIQMRVSQLPIFAQCPGEYTEVIQFDDELYTEDVDDDFTREDESSFLSSGSASLQDETESKVKYGHPDWLSACTSVFLDLGSNAGLAVQKLFEPEKYPGSNLSASFDRAFGAPEARRAPGKSSGLCALGLEPNPEHSGRLQRLELDYQARGWHVAFYPLAAWTSEGFMGFSVGGHDANHPGAHLIMHSTERWPGPSEAMVRTVDVGDFIRSLPRGSVDLMLVDIEGAELETLGQLLETKVLCQDVVRSAMVVPRQWEREFADVDPRSFAEIEQRVGELARSGGCGRSSATAVLQIGSDAKAADLISAPDAEVLTPPFLDVVESQDASLYSVPSSSESPHATKGSTKEGRDAHSKAMSESHKATSKVTAAKPAETTDTDYDHPLWLHSCSSILLDLGSNVGVTIEKFFEPERYPGAPLLNVFEETLGSSAGVRKKEDVCALGLEPNPRHWARLQSLQKTYEESGLRAHFYPFAAWSHDRLMAFNSTSKKSPSADDTTNLGAHLASSSSEHPGATSAAVRAVDLAGFIKSLPVGSVRLMVMDIEGAEYENLAHLMRQDLLCSRTIPRIAVEPHNWGEVRRWGGARTFPGDAHPRSFAAIRFRMSQLEQYNPCLPDHITEISELTDQTYQADTAVSQPPAPAPAQSTAPPTQEPLAHAASSAAFARGAVGAAHQHHGRMSAPVAAVASLSAEAPSAELAASPPPADVPEAPRAIDELIKDRLLDVPETATLVSTRTNAIPFEHPSWLDGCSSIFLDLGSNIGVNVRKFYEPESYPGAKVLPYMDQAFGTGKARRKAALDGKLCFLGFEPNPKHSQHLKKLEESYETEGMHAHFYPFAAWSHEGTMKLNVTGRRAQGTGRSEAAHLSMALLAEPAETHVVRTVDLAAFIQSLPAGSVRLALVDIEGAEYETLARLMQTNTLCQSSVKTVLIEAHHWGRIKRWGESSTFLEGVRPRSFKAIRQRLDQLAAHHTCDVDDSQGLVTEMIQLDDETYAGDVETETA